MKRFTKAAGAGLAAAGLLLLASPASAQSAPDKPRPVLGDDVYQYHPILQSVLQTPPLETLIRFRSEVYTNHRPHVFHMVIHLYRWRSAIQLKRPKGEWIEITPSVRYGLADLPPVGHHKYLDPADWSCLTGRFYIRVHVFGINHLGQTQSSTAYFPWAGFTKKDLNKGNVHKKPALKQAWKTKCQGHDTLIG